MHKKIPFIAVLLMCCLNAALMRGQTPGEASTTAQATVGERMAQFTDELNAAPYTTGISIWDLTDDCAVYSYNSYKVLRPASTQKLLTAISALDLLGLKHEYKTQAFYDGTVEADSILHGNITIVGDFDPMLSYDDIRDLVANFSALGIKIIDGKIIGDDRMKEKELYGSGWCWDDVPCSSMPYLSPLMFDRGKMSPQSATYSDNPAFHPTQWLVHVVDSLLQNNGIRHIDACNNIETNIRYCFYTCTRTIEDVLQNMMKNSDNLYAESMFYQLGNVVTPRGATYKNAAQIIESVIVNAGASISGVKIADGSGVSLYDYVTPDVEVALLRHAYRNSHIFQPLYQALPIAGIDGTLSSRMQQGNAYNNVHAKTGTVTGVSALAGYVTMANGHLLAFSIINNGLLSTSTGKNLQDRICQALAE